ncbi:hypothetical protein SLA2020_298660 [Shorea laevis]
MQNNSVPTTTLNHHIPSTPISTLLSPAAANNGGGFDSPSTSVNGPYPPGFRFRPTDPELILHYLHNNILKKPLPCDKIQDVKLYDHNPDTLTELYKEYGEDSCWYFITARHKKYPNGQRPDRGTRDGVGYWKATGADKKIMFEGTLIGKKKSLVFCEGDRIKNQKTAWLMHEYELPKEDSSNQVRNNSTASEGNDMQLDQSVLCKIYKKHGKSTKHHPRNDARNETVLKEVEQHNGQQSDFQGPENFNQPQRLEVNHNLLGYSDILFSDFGEEVQAHFGDPEAQCYSLQQLPEFRDQSASKDEDYYILQPPPESLSHLVDDHPGTKNYSSSREQFSDHGDGAPKYSGYGGFHAPQFIDFDTSKSISVYQRQTIQTANVATHSTDTGVFVSPSEQLK